MSLQIWLPLNGDTHNQGTSNIIMSGNPKEWSSSGKIGKCANFSGDLNNVIYNNTTQFNYIDDFSWSIWVNATFNTGGTAQFVFTNGRADAGGYGYGLQVGSASSYNIRFGNSTFSLSYTQGQWTHIAFTKNSNTIKIYKNGILYSTNTFSGTLPSYSDGNGLGLGCFHYSGNIYPYYGSINDFRIYNHCLSDKEIKEISKGLILHYKLDGSCGGSDNLVKNYVTSGALNSYSFPTFTQTYIQDNTSPSNYALKLKITGDTSSSTFSGGPYFADGTGHYISSMIVDEYYTATVLVKGTTAQDFKLNGNCEFLKNQTISIPSNRLNSQWQTLTITGQYNGNTSSMVAFTFYNSGKWTTGDEIYFSALKIERGNTSTHWTPNPTDIGDSGLIEYDCSGYGNDGIKNNNLITDSDSPRYFASTYFGNNSGTAYIKSPLSLSANEISCSFWIKPDASNGSYSIVCCNYNNPSSGFWIATNCEDSGLWFYTGTYVKGNPLLANGTWYYCCFTFKNGVGKWYKNGELVTTTDISSTKTSLQISNLSVGNSYTGSSWPTTNYDELSDFRIYSTALSEDDIKELYQTTQSIDKDGNIYAYEFIED